MAKVKQTGFQWDARFTKELKARINRYDMNVGILKDGPHYRPAKAVSAYAGGPVRKKSRKIGGTISDVSEDVRKRLGINFYTAPFRKPSARSVELQRFLREFIKYVREDKSGIRRIENAIQAVVRNPILRGEYGSNSSAAKKAKGFDRLLIDTGQLFKAIISKVTRRGGSK